MNFLNNSFKFNKILMMNANTSSQQEYDESEHDKRTVFIQNQKSKNKTPILLKPFVKAVETYARFNRSAIIKNTNKTLENVQKIERKTYEIMNPQDSAFKKFKSAFAKFSIKSPIESIKKIRADMKNKNNLWTTQHAKNIEEKMSITKNTIEKTKYQKIVSTLSDRKLDINFGVIKNELRTLKDNLNRELKDREKNNSLTESKRPEDWKHKPISDLKKEIKKLNTQIKRMDKLEHSAKIYNKELDFKIQNKANKKPIVERIRNKLAKIRSKINLPKQTEKSAGKFVLNSILHPQQTVRGIKETIKQKASGLKKDQYAAIETMKKDEKANAQINRLEEKLNKYRSLSENDQRGNVAFEASKLIGDKLFNKYNIDASKADKNYNKGDSGEYQTPQDALKAVKDAIKEVKQDLDKIIHGKHESASSKTMHKEILKEVQNIERSMEKAGKDIGSSHGFK
jgi:hypothetical protein